MQGNNLFRVRPPLTWIHRLDPRTKLLLLALSFVMVLLPASPRIVALATLAVLGHVSLAQAWRTLAPIRWLPVILALFPVGIWTVMAHGSSHLSWRISRDSLALGVAAVDGRLHHPSRAPLGPDSLAWSCNQRYHPHVCSARRKNHR